MTELSQQEIAELHAEPHLCHLATVRPDGRPHVTPIWYLEEDGKAFIMADGNSVKFRNVGHNSKVSLSIGTDQRPYKYVGLEGEGRITEDNLAQVIERIAARYRGPEQGRAYARELVAEGRIRILEVQVRRVLSWKSDD